QKRAATVLRAPSAPRSRLTLSRPGWFCRELPPSAAQLVRPRRDIVLGEQVGALPRGQRPVDQGREILLRDPREVVFVALVELIGDDDLPSQFTPTRGQSRP